ncbi:homoserine kinase [Serpentinicella alkaliphila]|uniref:Homoserine kinase n=1 Tax=Serpentinicella alkaliphila TaxID=1734049 RepID=A0A4R2TJ58_9FIRM|nr:homoserine kinase [Serpentinicella alkaliphila]TCQ02407.1 homoserine kinase [Serpentinicella alkaliphila]
MFIKVTVPATTANIGPGFDCLGIALSLYNTIEVKEIEEGIKVEVDGIIENDLEVNKENLVYKSMNRIFKEIGYTPKGIYIRQVNNIPFSRGLGSSAACIVGGLLAANELVGNPYSKDQILKMAVEIEGHPDNVAPALFGGFVVSTSRNERVSYIKSTLNENLKFLVGIPKEGLSTKTSREALPNEVVFEDAVFNTGNAALLVAAFMSGDYSKISEAISDRLHQPYRLKLMESLEKIFIEAHNENLKSIFLSGAGPTIIALDWSDNQEKEKLFAEVLQTVDKNWEMLKLTVDNKGAIVEL